MAGLIAMIAVFLVVTIEMTFSTMNGGSMGGCHSGPGLPVAPSAPGHNSASAGLIPTILEEAPDGTVRGVRPTPRHRRSASIGTELQKFERGGMGIAAEGNEVWDKSESEDSEDDDSGDSPETRALNSHANGRRSNSGGRPRSWSGSSQRRAGGAGGSRLTEDQQQQKQLLQVMLLEAGILFHSVFIGKTL